MFESDMQDLDPAQYGEADRREVDPPVEVEVATWSAAGTLDWWVRERREWWGWVRGADGRQRWIKAADLRPCPRRVILTWPRNALRHRRAGDLQFMCYAN